MRDSILLVRYPLFVLICLGLHLALIYYRGPQNLCRITFTTPPLPCRFLGAIFIAPFSLCCLRRANLENKILPRLLCLPSFPKPSPPLFIRHLLLPRRSITFAFYTWHLLLHMLFCFRRETAYAPASALYSSHATFDTLSPPRCNIRAALSTITDYAAPCSLSWMPSTHSSSCRARAPVV